MHLGSRVSMGACTVTVDGRALAVVRLYGQVL